MKFFLKFNAIMALSLGGIYAMSLVDPNMLAVAGIGILTTNLVIGIMFL